MITRYRVLKGYTLDENWADFIECNGITITHAKLGYGKIYHKGDSILLHRFITQASKGQIIDHINGDVKDNRLINLRVVTHQQNIFNSKIQHNNKSGIPGVYFDKKKSKWRAQITFNGQKIHLGYFHDLHQAKEVREMKERELFGEYVRHQGRGYQI